MTTALIGTRKGLFSVGVTDGVAHVTGHEFPGSPVTNTMVDPRDGAAYVSINHGHFGVHLHRSDGGGSDWVEIAVPEYPPQPPGVEHINPYTQKPVEWATQLGWVIEPGHAQEPGVLWCGTIPGGVFKSIDRGDSWQLMESHWNEPARAKWAGGGFDDAGTHSVCVDPREPGHVIIGMSCGGAWCTADGGDSWERATAGMRANFLPPDLADDPDSQDPHRIVRCLDAPDVLWTQHHAGIFRSVDNGREWVEIPEAGPSTFGFAVAAHPHDPLTAWFVPALSDYVRVPVDGALVVTRTRDGGQTFDVLSNGLPQEHAYDLVYRHCLDVDGSGEQLLMGSTTGSLWYSSDAGDHWQTVSNHLPPIASVRWSPSAAQPG